MDGSGGDPSATSEFALSPASSLTCGSDAVHDSLWAWCLCR
jgi:hypothetical protein